ncbi:unnamed protein product [Cuscuta campestris]|uniref:EF-hand domain-containing protein n=1 Tax=Cuscuta campestris TaxID=132261 RepID=A0A484NB56_9ASTE|nr:unnamed protein product [Cuscuta campestris]
MGLRSLFSKKKKSTTAASTGGATPSPEESAPPMLRALSISSSRLQIAEMEQVFAKFDANSDGKISASELGSILTSLGATATEQDLEDLIKEVDRDGDGHIDLQEFIELNTKDVDPEEIMANLKEAFSVYDINRDGTITAEELHQVMGSLGEGCSMAECRKMINGVDSDGDGMISFDEFKVMMMAGLA